MDRDSIINKVKIVSLSVILIATILGVILICIIAALQAGKVVYKAKVPQQKIVASVANPGVTVMKEPSFKFFVDRKTGCEYVQNIHGHLEPRMQIGPAGPGGASVQVCNRTK